jgi:hypothetical protein
MPPWMARGKGGPHASLPRERWAPCLLSGMAGHKTGGADRLLRQIVCSAIPAHHRNTAPRYSAAIQRRDTAEKEEIAVHAGGSAENGGENPAFLDTGRRERESCCLLLRGEYLLLLFITAVPNTKLCAWGEEDSGEHVLVPERNPVL